MFLLFSSFHFSRERCGRNSMHSDWYSNAASLFIYCAYGLQHSYECYECGYSRYLSDSLQVIFILNNKTHTQKFTEMFFISIIPLRIRAMAVFISLMFGRLGCILGAITTALLLDTHCEMVFYLSGTTLIGKKKKLIFIFQLCNKKIQINFLFFLKISSTAMAILSFFIPNIHKKITMEWYFSVWQLDTSSLI